MSYEEINPNNWIIFGDLHFAQVIHHVTFVDDITGIEYTSFLIKPSSYLVRRYNINDFDEEMIVKRKYSTSKIIHEPQEDGGNRWLIDSTIEGGETKLTRRHAYLTNTIDDMRKLLKSEKALKNLAIKELHDNSVQREATLKQQVKLMKIIREASSHNLSIGDEEETDFNE